MHSKAASSRVLVNATTMLLEYIVKYLEPRPPFTGEFTNYPARSRYYEVFVATSTFLFSILLIYSMHYLMLCRIRWLLNKESALDIVQLLIFVIPFQACVLDYPVASYTIFALAFNGTCCLVFALCCLHKRCLMGHTAGLSDVKLLAVVQSPEPRALSLDTSFQLPNPDARSFNEFLTAFRSIVYISTAVCIFARDQPCWNNDFSKASTFGTGVMDIGLGCFIVCVGSLGPTATRHLSEVKRPEAMKRAGVQFLILGACGLVKSIIVVVTIAIKGVAFQDSWLEYGVHWNAFYSLGVAKLAGTVAELYALPTRAPPLLAALLVGLGYEALLASGGVADYILAPGEQEPHNRDSLVGANREGLLSVPGLLALYLAGLQLGRWTHRYSRRRARLAACLAALLVGCLAYRVFLAHSPRLLLPESRRLLNLSYAAWIVAFSAFCLLHACIAFSGWSVLLGGGGDGGIGISGASGVSGGCVPLHLRRVDSCGLLYFLVSNLLTGLGNLVIDRVFPYREATDGLLCFLLVLAYSVAVYPAARMSQRLVSVRALTRRLTGYCSVCC